MITHVPILSLFVSIYWHKFWHLIWQEYSDMYSEHIFQHQLWQRVWHIFWDVFAQLFEQKIPEAVPNRRTQKRTDPGRDLRARQEPTKTVLTVTPARARCLSLPRKQMHQMHSNATECYMPYWSLLIYALYLPLYDPYLQPAWSHPFSLHQVATARCSLWYFVIVFYDIRSLWSRLLRVACTPAFWSAKSFLRI